MAYVCVDIRDVEVEVNLDSFDTEDLKAELEQRGYHITQTIHGAYKAKREPYQFDRELIRDIIAGLEDSGKYNYVQLHHLRDTLDMLV